MAAPLPRLLTIAGSDSGGGAGIQADLKAFAKAGAHGMSAITAVTAQSTAAVNAVYPLPPEAIVEQVRAVAGDIGVDAVKIGMVGNAEAIEAVAAALELVGDVPVVLDPVMVAESGARLLDEEAVQALRDELVPRATVVTPNLAEAAALTGRDASDDPEELARAVHALGPKAVVVTGGHREDATDVFFDGERIELIPGERQPRRGGPRLGLHALLDAGGGAGDGGRAAGGGKAGEASGRGGRARRPARAGPGRGPGGRARPEGEGRGPLEPHALLGQPLRHQLRRLAVVLVAGGLLEQSRRIGVQLVAAVGEVQDQRGHHRHGRVLLLGVHAAYEFRQLGLQAGNVGADRLVAILEVLDQVGDAIVAAERVHDVSRAVHDLRERCWLRLRGHLFGAYPPLSRPNA